MEPYLHLHLSPRVMCLHFGKSAARKAMLLWLLAVPVCVVQPTINWIAWILKKKSESKDYEARSFKEHLFSMISKQIYGRLSSTDILRSCHYCKGGIHSACMMSLC